MRLITETAQGPAGETPYLFPVLHYQDNLIARGQIATNLSFVNPGIRHFNGRKQHFDASAPAGSAVDEQLAATLLDKIINHGQTEPGAGLDGFGGEKWFDGLTPGFFIHADAIILHRQDDIITGG